jgi:hypothetical protein
MSKSCCPYKREQATTDQDGQFRIEHPGDVIHLSKDKLQPQAFVLGLERSAVHITLEPSTDSLVVPVCGRLGSGRQRIGWAKYGLQFDIAKHSVKILGGKPDADYVRYVIKPKTGKAYLELWFGPYAMSELPGDDQFINSDKYAQRNVIASDGGLLGMDSWGQQRGGGNWRQTAVVGQGGSRYQNATPEDSSLFDQIVNSLCEVPYPSR